MPYIFYDGFLVFSRYFFIVLFFFLSIFGAGSFISNIFFKKELNPKFKLLISLSIGGTFLLLLTYLLGVVTHFLPFLLKPGSFLLFFLLSFVAVKHLWMYKKVLLQPQVLFGGFLLLILFFLRLSFLNYILLPPYSDSPIHYQIIETFLYPNSGFSFRYSLDNIFSNYYHLGFHSLAAWLVSISGISITDSISLLGQFFLVLAPMSVFFLVYVISGDVKGSFFASLLAAIGWHMPAFAVNWGKFPALAALSLFPAVIGFLLLLAREKKLYRKNVIIFFFLLVGLGLLHTRVIILVFASVGVYFLSLKMDVDTNTGYLKSILYSILFSIVLFPLLKPLQYFYAQILVLGIFIVLLPFAFKTYANYSIAVFLFVVVLWMVGAVPNFFKIRELLNKEFLEMVLFLPLSVLGGMGFAGLGQSLKRLHDTYQKLIPIILVFLVVFSFIQQGAIYPDPCCNYFQDDDALAFEFLSRNLPENSLVLIAAVKHSTVNSGTDAGIWIYPLLKIPTNNFFYGANWSVYERIEDVCQFGAENIFIYVGGRAYGFDDSKLASAEWYKLVFRSGKTKIYQIRSCLPQ